MGLVKQCVTSLYKKNIQRLTKVSVNQWLIVGGNQGKLHNRKRKKLSVSWFIFIASIGLQTKWVLLLNAVFFFTLSWMRVPIQIPILIGHSGLPRVKQKSGKNKLFSRLGNCQEILNKCQGILAIYKCHGILLWQLFFSKDEPSIACILFPHHKICVSLASLSRLSHHTFSKCFTSWILFFVLIALWQKYFEQYEVLKIKRCIQFVMECSCNFLTYFWVSGQLVMEWRFCNRLYYILWL